MDEGGESINEVGRGRDQRARISRSSGVVREFSASHAEGGLTIIGGNRDAPRGVQQL